MADMQSNIGKALRIVNDKISIAVSRRPPELSKFQPRLVAVSKTKPKEDIIEAYNCGQRHFGENYIKELVEKANDSEILEKCKDIRWHFIGHLQRNKVNKVAAVPNLYMVETIDSDKIAAALNSSLEKVNLVSTLKVMIQVNTSSEESKSGIDSQHVPTLVKYIQTNCPKLQFIGLMTIGAAFHDYSQGPNPDFILLTKCREEISKELNVDANDYELSMGMSADFEQAIMEGSTNVRVGSTIFGSRSYPTTDSSSI